MNNRPEGPDNNSSQSETDIIRRAEVIEREKRARRIAAQRRRERLLQSKRKRIKQTVFAWAVVIGAFALVIGILSSIITSCANSNKTGSDKNAVSDSEKALVTGFSESDSIVYSASDNTIFSTMNSLVTDILLEKNTENPENLYSTQSSQFLWQADKFSWHSDKSYVRAVKDILRDYGMFSNGYVWSSLDKMKSEQTDKYFYDTNARFISAICRICLWEADTSFLYEIDLTKGEKHDSSKDKTVLEKLEKAVGYYFDKNDINGGGIRYNESDGLVYILTEDNDGTTTGAGSNFWYNNRFGYLDAYNNIAFYQAMCDLSSLYSFMGQPENAEKYQLVAQKNAKAINEKFWDENKGRYIGCIDVNGKEIDNGFVFVNLEAISCGVADSKKAKKILNWIDAENDSAVSKMYVTDFAPRSTTIPATDLWWDYVDGKFPLSGSAAFGKHWQNGGTAIINGYYDLLARKTADKSGFKTILDNVCESFENSKLQKALEKEDVYGPATVSSVLPAAVIYGTFGVSTDGVYLTVDPTLPEFDSGYAGVKNIGFASNSYGFLFGKNDVYITSQSQGALRLNLGGLLKNTEYQVCVVTDFVVTSTENVTTDNYGFAKIMQRFGKNSYIRVTPVTSEKK